MSVRLPAPNCAICQKPLETTGGVRVYLSAPNGVVLQNHSQKLLPGWRLAQLPGNHRNECLAFYGSIWNEETINRAIDALQHGYLPWFCQRCGNAGLCLHCGHPLTRPPGAEIINDDGTTSHVPVFAGLLPCPACGRQNERFSFDGK